MEVIEVFYPNNGLGEDPVLHLEFKRFETIVNDCRLFIGDAYNKLNESSQEGNPRYFFSLEEPNFCTAGHHVDTLIKADKIFTLCPYTAASAPKRETIFFPTNENYILNKFEKLYDVIYTGSIHSPLINQFVDVIKKYNYYDDWNVIENWFTPDEDFIYFYSKEDLDQKIKTILENYDEYSKIGENAYNKAINNYTTKHFIQKYIGFK